MKTPKCAIWRHDDGLLTATGIDWCINPAQVNQAVHDDFWEGADEDEIVPGIAPEVEAITLSNGELLWDWRSYNWKGLRPHKEAAV